MELNSRLEKNVKILTIAGNFDNFTAHAAQRWLEEATSSNPANIVVNLAKVDFLDSTGLSTLVQALKHSREKYGDLRLCGLQQPIRILFELTRLDKVFEIYGAEEDAVNAFSRKE